MNFCIDTRLVVTFIFMLGLCPMTATAQEPADGPAEQHWIEVRIANREVVGERVIRVTQGDAVALRWITDEAAEVHIHGYDIRFDISPDAPAEVEFSAHATGRYAVTSHGFGGQHDHGHETLVYIEVYPN
jgi:FtsP/CotA-like multicopper oxidase with cupredoxin domain